MLRTIYVMWLRELKKYLRARSRIVGALGQPITYLLALGYGFGSVFQFAEQGSYIQFLVPGIIGMSIIFTSIFNGMQIIWDRQFGFLTEPLVAPVPRVAIMLGRTIGGATVSAVSRLHCVPVGAVFFISSLQLGHGLPAILVTSFNRVTFSALGIAVASLLTNM